MDTTNLKNRLGAKVQMIQDPISSEAQTSLIPTNSGYVALGSNALEIIKDNLKNQPLSVQLFDIVKAPSGGSTVFSVPSISGDEAEKELTGIILDYTTPRAYWDSADPVEGTPPVCLSHNSIMSQDGKVCAHCPYNDFGSRDGESNAKACKESVLLFLLRSDNALPLLVRIPVSSKNRFLKYSTRLLSSLTPINGVVTKISLEKATNKSGKPYAVYNFEAVSTLSPEEAAQARIFAKQFMQALNATELTPEVAKAS